MSKVYQLSSDFVNYSIFCEEFSDVGNTFFKKYADWKIIDFDNYQPIKYSLLASDTGLKNYKMDISKFSSALVIFSEKSIAVLKPILETTGQIIPIITPSKRKKFFGFYANKNVYDISIVNLNKTDYVQYEKGKLFRKIVLNNKFPKNDYIFGIEEDSMHCFVTDKFKKLVEDNDLKGFDFSREIEVSDE